MAEDAGMVAAAIINLKANCALIGPDLALGRWAEVE